MPEPIIRGENLGAGFIGTAQSWSQRTLAMLHSLGGISEATVINHPWQTDISRAAFAHGGLIGAFECEPLTGSHASGIVVPAALTVSQRERLDGQKFPTSLAVGFEISARIVRTPPSVSKRCEVFIILAPRGRPAT